MAQEHKCRTRLTLRIGTFRRIDMYHRIGTFCRIDMFHRVSTFHLFMHIHSFGHNISSYRHTIDYCSTHDKIEHTSLSRSSPTYAHTCQIFHTCHTWKKKSIFRRTIFTHFRTRRAPLSLRPARVGPPSPGWTPPIRVQFL